MKNKKVFQKFIFISFVIVMFFGFNIKKTQAGVWGEAMASEIMHEAWSKLQEEFKGTMLAQLKNQALQMINDQMSAFTGDYLVSDYNALLSDEVKSETDLVMEGYFDTIESEDARNGVRADGFIANARNLVRNTVASEVYGDNDNYSNIEKYIDGDVLENLFKESKGGGIDAIPMALSSNNNTGGMYLKGLAKATNVQNVIKEAKQTEVIAGKGYKGSGTIAGSTFAEMMASSKTFQQDLFANAENVGELVALMGTSISDEVMNDYDSQVADLQTNMQKQMKKQQESMKRKAFRKFYQYEPTVGTFRTNLHYTPGVN